MKGRYRVIARTLAPDLVRITGEEATKMMDRSKHRCGAREIYSKYVFQQGTRRNIGIRIAENKILWLSKMGYRRVTNYRRLERDNPYLTASIPTIPPPDIPEMASYLNGSGTTSEWLDIRLTRLQFDQYQCTRCKNKANLDVHHVIPRTQRPDLALNLDNLITLCENCHIAAHRAGVLNGRTISLSDAT